MHTAREIGQESADHPEGGIFGCGEPLDRAVVAVHGNAAEFLLGELFAGAAAHDRRPSGEQLPDSGHHDGEVRHDQPRRAEAHDRAEARRHHRHHGEIVDHGVPPGVDGQVGVAGLICHLDAAAAARAVQQPYHRQPHLVRVLLGEDLLGVDRRVAGAAAHGEVVGAEHDRAPVDARRTGDEVGRPDRDEAAVSVIVAEAGQRADLCEAARIGQPVDALTHRQPARGALALDLRWPAHGPGQFPAAVDFLHLRRPAAWFTAARRLGPVVCSAHVRLPHAGRLGVRIRPAWRPPASRRAGDCPAGGHQDAVVDRDLGAVGGAGRPGTGLADVDRP